MAKKQKYYQRPDGLFETIRTINGKRVAFRGKTCREVDQKLLAYRGEQERGRLFPKVADEWEREHEKTVRESTRVTYRASLQRIKARFTGPVREIRPMDVKRYITSLEKENRSASGVQMDLGILKMIFSHAVLAGDIESNPAAEVHPSRGLPRKKRLALTEEQEQLVRDNWDKAPFGLFPYFLLYTGMRRGEALALSYSDVDRKAGLIHVNKKLNYAYGNNPHMDPFTKSENGVRDVPLLAPLAAALPKDRVGLIFPGDDGGFMTRSGLQKRWSAYCKAVGLEGVTPHCFRHSFATMCYEAGLDPRQAAQLAGDTPEVLEKVYTHLRESRRQTGAEKLAAFIAESV